MHTSRLLFLKSLFVMCIAIAIPGRAQDPSGLKECSELKECNEHGSAALAVASPQDMPQVKKQVSPHYPEVLKRAGIEGEVYLQVTINEQGKVEKVKTLKTTHQDLVEAAVDAVKQWEFAPATKDGKPIRAEVTIPFKFKLAEKSGEALREELMNLQEDVHRLLRGEPTDGVKTKVGNTAYAVVGNKQEYLPSLFSDKSKRDLLIEGPESKIENTRLAANDACDMAFLVLKTKPSGNRAERFHTVIFTKSKEGQWTISAWQAGE
jgi:TonB family protein